MAGALCADAVEDVASDVWATAMDAAADAARHRIDLSKKKLPLVAFDLLGIPPDADDGLLGISVGERLGVIEAATMTRSRRPHLFENAGRTSVSFQVAKLLRSITNDASSSVAPCSRR